MKNFTIDGYPSLFRRLAAIIYDCFLSAAILLASMALMIVLRMNFGQPLAEHEVAISGAWRIPSFLFCLVNLSVFYCYFWVNNGRTLGMQAWRLAIVSTENKGISWRQAYTRFFAVFISVLPCFLGYIWVLFDHEKQSFHDRLSHTRTVLLKKR